MFRKKEKRDIGRPRSPEPYQKFSFTLSLPVLEEIDALRKNLRMTRSEFVAMCISRYFDSPESEECKRMRRILINIREAVEGK